MRDATRRGSSPWFALSGVIAVYFGFGLTIGLMAPLVDEISTDLELSRSAMGSILGAWALIYVFTAIPAGNVVDRLGLRTAMGFGAASIVTSLVLRSFAVGGVSLFAAVAVFGVGGPLVSIATPKLVASLFDDDARRLPTGLAVAAPTLGSAVGFALPNPVLLPLFDDDWRSVLLVGAAVSAASLVYWLWATRYSLTAAPPPASRLVGTTKRLLGLSTMRWILAITLFSFAFSHGLNGWLPEILTDAGLSDDQAGYLAAASTVVGIGGSLTFARATSASRRASALVMTFVALAVGSIGLAGLDGVGVATVTIVIGFVRAGVIPLMFLIMMDDPDIGAADMGAATGLFFAVGEIGGFCGPWSLGAIADATGGFTAASLTLATIGSGAALGALGLTRRPLSRAETCRCRRQTT